jgi:hypothetical protein
MENMVNRKKYKPNQYDRSRTFISVMALLKNALGLVLRVWEGDVT